MTDMTANGAQKSSINLAKVLGPTHVWALGVGIVLVGEFMGWNFSVEKGGALGSIIACWIIGLLYTCVAMIDSEVTSTVAAAGATESVHVSTARRVAAWRTFLADHDGELCIVMERLHGRSLADKLSREHIIAPGFARSAAVGASVDGSSDRRS